MNQSRSPFSILLVALCAAAMLGGQAAAAPLPAPAEPVVRTAQADCNSVGQQVAAQNGGTLARASQSEQGGQSVCVVVVLVPGKDGKRPRRVEFVVPN